MISVIVPVYNIEKYLDQCIQSVQAQTYKDWELLLVDDCSTDGSYGICQKYASEDSRIRLLRNEVNCGSAVARNAGLDHANGEWITFLDGDDAFTEDMLAYLHHLQLRTHADIVLAGWYSTKCPTRGGRVKMQMLKGKQIMSHYLCFRKIGGYVWGKLFAKSFIGEERFFPMRMGDDGDFAIRMFAKARSVCYTNAPKYFYRIRQDSVSQRGQFTENSLIGVKYVDLRKEYCLRHSSLSEKEFERLWAVYTFVVTYGRYEKMLRLKAHKKYENEFYQIRGIMENTYKTAMRYSIHPKTRILVCKYLILRKMEKRL